MNISTTTRGINRMCLLLFLAWIAVSCNDNEKPSVNSSPVVQLTKDVIESFPNTQFIISANISDEAGLQSIKLQNAEWLLDKEIQLSGAPKQYELRYKFTVPSSEQIGSEHTIKIVATNIGAKNTEITVPVNLTLDITAPALTVTKPSDGGSYIIKSGESEFKIDISFTDDKALSALKITCAPLGLDKDITLSGTSGTYSADVDFDTPGTYEITFNVIDATGNQTSITKTIKLIDALQFDKLFLTDVFTQAELTSDLFGVPMLMTSSNVSGETGYVFSTKYYSASAGTPIKFIPQESAFDPFVFGANTDVEGGLEMGTSAPAITLPAKGYYDIKVDLRDMTYSATLYTPSDDLQATMFMAGRGFDGQNWDPSVATAMTKNSSNPYEFTLQTQLYYNDNGSAGTVQWIFIHSQSWNMPYWRFDSATPHKVIPSISSDLGGTNVNIIVPSPTIYTVTFDYHLNYCKVVKQ
ncbi:MAG TPA: immunoglobulin-like domain-containing protein [Cyclobacteriaceae bacterium]